MNEKNETYNFRKLIYSIIFNDNLINYYDWFNDLYFLDSLKNIVEEHTKHNYLGQKVKNNIYNFLQKIREYKDDKRVERINIINEIIKLLNTQIKDKSLVFYSLELYKRRCDRNYLFKIPNDVIINEIPNVHTSICFDVQILASHLDATEEDFQNVFFPLLIDCEYYYESLNAILYENPEIFRNELFYNRMNRILNYNNKLYEDTNKEKYMKKANKIMLKRINKVNKHKK